MKFADIPYIRINYKELEKNYLDKLNNFKNAKTFESAFYSLVSLEEERKFVRAMSTICEIRHTMDTRDEFYTEESKYIDSIMPHYDLLESKYQDALVNSDYREELYPYLGKEIFEKYEIKSSIMSEEILGLLEEENKYSAEYTKLVGGLITEIDGKKYTLSNLYSLRNTESQEERIFYTRKIEDLYLGIKDELDEIFHKLVGIRHEIAKTMGFSSYVDIGYRKMGRTSYKREDIDEFKLNVKKYLVPLLTEIMVKVKDDLKLETMYDFDEDITKPVIVPKEEPIKGFTDIFGKLSYETDYLFSKLKENEFYDIKIREGKIQGAYCNYLCIFNLPFLFMTYNNTQGAVSTFAHEFGHGLASFTHRSNTFMDKAAYSSDIAEIHSMSMEFLIYPYIDSIIKEENIKGYKFIQLKNALALICYGSMVDEFQHQIYDRPEMSKEDRLILWKNLEKEFVPFREYLDDGFFSEGRFWQRQTHIFKWPFYYIDYVLAQMCALQIHYECEKDYEKGKEIYFNLIELGGEKSFVDTILSIGLNSPFKEDTMKELASMTKKELEKLI